MEIERAVGGYGRGVTQAKITPQRFAAGVIDEEMSEGNARKEIWLLR